MEKKLQQEMEGKSASWVAETGEGTGQQHIFKRKPIVYIVGDY